MKDVEIPHLGLARTIARLAAAYALAEPAERQPIVRRLDECSWLLPSGAHFTETDRKDAEAVAAADMIETPDPRAPHERLVLTFSVIDARVVLRRLASSPTDGLDRFGRLLALEHDRTINPGNPLHLAMRNLHELNGRGRLVAINCVNSTMVYRIDGIGVRRRPFRVEGEYLHVGRFCMPLAAKLAA